MAVISLLPSRRMELHEMMITTYEIFLSVAERGASVVVTHVGAVTRLPHGESILLGGIGAGLILLSYTLRRMMSPQPASHPDPRAGATRAASVEAGAS
jgi:hypothetical protein